MVLGLNPQVFPPSRIPRIARARSRPNRLTNLFRQARSRARPSGPVSPNSSSRNSGSIPLSPDPQPFGHHRQIGHSNQVADQFQGAGSFHSGHLINRIADNFVPVLTPRILFIAAGKDRLLGCFSLGRGFAQWAFEKFHALRFSRRVGKLAGHFRIDGADIDTSSAGFIALSKPFSPSMVSSRCWGSGRLVDDMRRGCLELGRLLAAAARFQGSLYLLGTQANTRTCLPARIRLRARPPPGDPTPINPNNMVSPPH